jgi:bacterioferritin-associated ferredoxin
MYVCICQAVSDRAVFAAIDNGADTVYAVGCATRAGTACGMCQERIEEIIEERCGECPLAAQQVA